MTVPNDKQAVRAHFRALRRGFSAAYCEAGSADIVEQLKGREEFQRARSVALFWPILERREVDLRVLDEVARRLGKAVYYPWMSHGLPLECGFRLVEQPEQMRLTQYGLREPAVGSEAQVGDVDLLIAPALAVTGDGQRIGYGAGCYDRLLARFSPPAYSVVVAFEAQLAEALPMQSHDQRCAAVVIGRPRDPAV